MFHQRYQPRICQLWVLLQILTVCAETHFGWYPKKIQSHAESWGWGSHSIIGYLCPSFKIKIYISKVYRLTCVSCCCWFIIQTAVSTWNTRKLGLTKLWTGCRGVNVSEAWFYCISLSNPSTMDFSQWVVNATSLVTLSYFYADTY